MIDINIIAGPVAGAVIGYFTNWLAIKMLFKPYNERRIFGIKLPFTPGLIPKEKERISNTLGKTVGNCLLTEDAIMESLSSPEAVENFEKIFDGSVEYLKQSTLTIDEGLEQVLKEEKSEVMAAATGGLTNCICKVLDNENLRLKIIDFVYLKCCLILDKNINDMDLQKYSIYIKDIVLIESKNLLEAGTLRNNIEKGIWNFILKLKEDERKLNEVIPYSSIHAIKDYVSIKMPNIVNGLLELTENPEVEKNIKEKIGGIITQLTGSFMGMFVNEEKVYNKIKTGASEYFNNTENQPEIDSMVSTAIDKIMETSLGGVAGLAAGEMREFTVNKAVDAILNIVFDEKTMEGVIDKFGIYLSNKGGTIRDMLISCEPDFDNKFKIFVNSSVNSMYREYTKEKINSAVCKWTKSVVNIQICDIMSHVDIKRHNKFKSIVFVFTSSVVKKCAPFVIDALNIPQIVENRINSFDMEYTEELVSSIAQKELNAITVVGGILGFVIGCIPMVMSLL